jgi:Leucine-rich repeat (LRR) protein
MLEKLDLYHNEIVKLPKLVHNKLKVLNVGKNKLKDLNGFS